MKQLTLTLCFLFITSSAYAALDVIDWPHNQYGCSDCHSYSLWWEFSPVSGDYFERAEKINPICGGCHNTNPGDDDSVASHHSATIAQFIETDLDPWTRACSDCHDPHFQAQINWYGDPGVANEELFLVTGSLTISEWGSDNTTFIYDNMVTGVNPYWGDNVTTWTNKSGKFSGSRLMVALPVTEPAGIDPTIFEITSVSGDTTSGSMVVSGLIDADDDNATFGLFYGQLIRDIVAGPEGPANVKFFDPYGGGFVDDVNNEGLCQVCHTQTSLFAYDDNDTVIGLDHNQYIPGSDDIRKDGQGNSGKDSRCTACHVHRWGFAPVSDSGEHILHLGMSNDCNLCHTSGTPNHLTEVGCNVCHNDGRGPDSNLLGTEGVDYIVDSVGNRYGLPNNMDYREKWFQEEGSTYSLNCNSCHNGRLNIDDVMDTANHIHDPVDDTQCDLCHKGNEDVPPKLCPRASEPCFTCHDGPGPGIKDDYEEPAVGMQTYGHERLVSSKWVRQYDCYYCHVETVSETDSFLSKHANQDLNVDIKNPGWHVDGEASPEYTYNDPVKHPLGLDEYGQLKETNTCYNVYCHTDGTTQDPEMRPYPWDEGHQDCNACHGHAPGTNCFGTEDPQNPGTYLPGCHDDGRSWDDYPDKKWLSAMPMYTNTGPRSQKANSHYRHLFTGFSCEECHYFTIKSEPGQKDGCLACHESAANLTDTMSESSHINPDYHVNRSKNVVFFEEEGTYNPINKSCDNTACHEGNVPEWGGSVYDSVVCRKCHGSTDADVDDFGNFNEVRAKINLNQWADSGHGRQGFVADNGTSDNPYPSGNPPANFPDNGCWYCHDSRVLHQNEERPFRLIQHEHFSLRFELECVFCHMEGKDYECLTCHDISEDIGYKSLAPQLADIGALPGVINPPYITEREDHSGLTGGCSAAECHEGDLTRHHTGVAVYEDTTVKEDVRNAYIQMGVCLKCHDDDSGGQCVICHIDDPATPENELETKYVIGFDPGHLDSELEGRTDGVIAPKLARASSFHFGYKHFNAYEASLPVQLDTGTVSDNSTSTYILIDRSKVGVWSPDQFVGLRVTITSGVNSGLTRPIVRNNLIDIDDNVPPTQAMQITVAPPFPDGQQLQPNDTYEIMDHVWKGGKFCWDCHDPHGDDNIYMVQNEVATRTDGVVGKPITRKAVSFIRKTTGTDYVDLEADQETGEYNGICNVCHTDPAMHYTANSGNGHNSSRICTECHEHRFTNSHASGNSCDSCHRNRPVPRHTAFGQARDCTKCHKDAINGRMNIMAQFSANSHHVQGVKVTNKHCYACHWESTPDGVIDLEKHEGYNYKTHVSIKNADVDLVVWGAGVRPTIYDDCATDDGNFTAVSFKAQDIDVWTDDICDNATMKDRRLKAQRLQVDSITTHCLGCHSDKNNNTQPFNLVDPENGDCKTPRQYAWDRSSIEARYSDNSTTSFGKYSGPNVAQKEVTKAFSAHGNAESGGGGWSSTDGEDQNVTDVNSTRAGAYNIQCFDCHSSHGSMVEGVSSSYVTFNGTNNGANLKETQAGKGGYTMTYKATANPNPNTINPYQAGAGQCFDCHDTSESNTQVSVNSVTPWGYSDTFGATAPIRGYRDSERFGEGTRGVNERFSFKPTALSGGHFKASHRNVGSSNYDPSGNSDISPMGTINGLCTPCHDPHGISPSMGANDKYAIPLLKGTWVTSPYKEDSPTLDDDGYNGGNYYRNYRNNFYYDEPPQQRADGRDTGAWRTDRNTFNQDDLSLETSYPSFYDRVGEEPQQFAGLCLRCHPKSSLTTDIDPGDNTTQTENLTWKSKERIHRSVKGWGWGEDEGDREHSFTCSKCHSAHVSGLPRLMKTNCLNYTHRGLMGMGGMPGDSTNRFGKFPNGFWTAGEFTNDSTATCHGADTANGPTGWPANQGWNDVTPWEGQ